MAWIKDFKCRGCGSTLGKWLPGARIPYCATCCRCQGDILLDDSEATGRSLEEMMAMIGVEHGEASSILPRINAPGARFSYSIKDDHLYIRKRIL